MWSDRVSNPGPLTLESDALPTALCDPAFYIIKFEENFGDVFTMFL